MPVAVIGCEVEGRANFVTVGYISRVNMNPPMLGISLNKKHYSCRGIAEGKGFSVNYVAGDLLRQADRAGLVSGAREDKSGLFETCAGDIPGAPVLTRAVLAHQCKLAETVLLPTHILYIGEIVSTWAQEADLDSAGRMDFTRRRPLFLSMPDNHYFELGPVAGDAFDPLNREQ